MNQYILVGRQPVLAQDLLSWAQWLETADRHVAETRWLGKGIRLSTVFLGLDHQWGEGPPILFESMVFGGALSGRMERYHTWEEAEAGHQAIAEEISLSLAESQQ